MKGMKKWSVPCIDNKTHKVIVLSETSYNSSCFYLGWQVGSPNRIFEEGGLTVFEYPTIRYYFDEERGMLLKD